MNKEEEKAHIEKKLKTAQGNVVYHMDKLKEARLEVVLWRMLKRRQKYNLI